MTKKTNLVWRLKDLPTIQEIGDLMQNEIITKEEARQLLFNEVDEKDKIAKLEQEVDYLKQALSDANRGITINKRWVEALPHPLLFDPFNLFKDII